ncbi:MAG: hypothetical protein HOV97_17785, partial [Nonomuraea sp.]|nr:hypothetical protein [Nonomuraea sp.]
MSPEIPPDADPYTLTLPTGGDGLTWQLPEESDPGVALPCVILADRAGLTEFAALQRGLRTLGVPSLRIHAESVDDLHIAADIADRSLTVNGRRVLPTVTWVRHFSPRAIQNSASSPFRADSWCALVGQISHLAA